MGVTTATAVAAAATTAAVGFAGGFFLAPEAKDSSNPRESQMYLSKGGWKKKKEEANVNTEYVGDSKKGAALFKAKCATCHTCVPNGPTIQGPNLYGIMGKEGGKSKGFRFTKNIIASNLVWDDETMFKWLENPKQMVKGTSMAFPGFKKDTDRHDVIAYLHTLSAES